MTLIDWLVIAGYFGVLAAVVVGTLRRRKIESGEDLFLGGRSVGWLAIGASIFAANIGSEHLIGLAGSGAVYGMSLSHLEFHSFIIIFMCWVLLPFYYKSGVSTMPEFLERRFGARARWILSLVSLAAYVLTKISVTVFAGALFFEVMMPEVQLTVGGTVVSSFWIGAVATVLLAGVYSSIGGLSAVVYTDLVQTGIILLGTLSVTGFALHYLGGPVEGWATLKATIRATGNVEQFGLWHSLSHKAFPWLGLIVASTTIGVWYWCTDQFIVQRCLAGKNLTNARRGAIWGACLKLAPVFLFLVPGMLGFALHHNHVTVGGEVFAIPLKADGSLNGDTVFPTLVQSLLPVGFRGLVVAGMIAALMSSLASLFNSVSTLFTVDVYQKLRPESSQKALVFVGRTTTVVMTALGLLWLPIMKSIAGGGLYQYIQSVQSFLAPPIVAVFLTGLFWKRMNLRGAVWGLGLGFALGMAKLTLNAVCPNPDGFALIQDFYFSGLLLLTSVLVIVVASLSAPAPDPKRIASLTFATLDDGFRRENRASWDWRDVVGSAFVLAVVIACYAYFWNWLGTPSERTAEQGAPVPARWISGQSVSCDSPVLRKSFSLERTPEKAVLELSVAGWCEVRINGRPVNDWLMWPVVTDYPSRLDVHELDVTPLLRAGENAIEIQLGNGWFNCRTKEVWGFAGAPWIDWPMVRGELFADGRRVVRTDGSWTAVLSPIVFNQLRNGEFYDARLENSTNAAPATCMTYPPRGALRPVRCAPCPVRAFERFRPVARERLADGRMRYDFGVNISGWCEIEVVGRAGAKVELDYDESVDARTGGPLGHVVTFVKSGRGQHDEYALAGRAGGETWHPRFVYHGFRYVWVRTTGEVSLKSVAARFVHSDFRTVGTVETDNETFAKLQRNTMRSYLSNFVGIPTDCPHREKNGWTGDAALAMATGLWNFGGAPSYLHFLDMMLDTQRPNGQVSCILPTAGTTFGFGWGSGPAWDNALFEIPWQLYVRTGDAEPLSRAYDATCRYLDYLDTVADDKGLMDYGLGDWCPGVRPPLESVITSTGYWYSFLRRQAAVARILRKPDAARFEARARQVRKAFREAFVGGDGRVAGNDHPTALATAVYFGLVEGDEEKRTVELLVERIRRDGHRCTFGILGAKFVPRVLADHGYADDAFEIFVQPDAPGYAWIANRGETTLWESFDGHDSHNHIMYGDLSAWAYEYAGGIRLDEGNPAFGHIVLKPSFLRKAGRFKVTHDVPGKGAIESGWERKTDGTVVFRAVLPQGVTATLKLPGREDETVTGEVERTVSPHSRTGLPPRL